MPAVDSLADDRRAALPPIRRAPNPQPWLADPAAPDGPHLPRTGRPALWAALNCLSRSKRRRRSEEQHLARPRPRRHARVDLHHGSSQPQGRRGASVPQGPSEPPALSGSRRCARVASPDVTSERRNRVVVSGHRFVNSRPAIVPLTFCATLTGVSHKFTRDDLERGMTFVPLRSQGRASSMCGRLQPILEAPQ